MKLFHTCLLAVLPLVVTLPGTVLASTIYANQVLATDHTGNFTFTTADAFGNVLNAEDGGGINLDLSWAATGQTFIKLGFGTDIGWDGTSAYDLDVIAFTDSGEAAAAIWVVIGDEIFNVGNTRASAVWGDPEGGRSSFDSGWVVFDDNGSIDFDFFFGIENPYYHTIENQGISAIYISGWFQSNVTATGSIAASDLTSTTTRSTTQNFDLDAVVGLSEAAVVPVPAAAWLFASGLFGLIAVSRQRKG